MNESFKTCGKCSQTWHERKDLVSDPQLALIGYQPTYGTVAEGLLLFTHIAAECGSTLAVLVGDFEDFLPAQPEFANQLGTDACPGNCLRVHDLQACSVPCQLRAVRQLIQVLKRHELPSTQPSLPILDRPMQLTARSTVSG